MRSQKNILINAFLTSNNLLRRLLRFFAGPQERLCLTRRKAVEMQHTNSQLPFPISLSHTNLIWTFPHGQEVKVDCSVNRLFGGNGAISGPQRKRILRRPGIHQPMGSPPCPPSPHANTANKIDEEACENLDKADIRVAPTKLE